MLQSTSLPIDGITPAPYHLSGLHVCTVYRGCAFTNCLATYVTEMNNNSSICSRRVRGERTASSVLVACSANGPESKQPATMQGIFRLALLSGAVAGFTVDAVLFPLDTLKTRLQLAATSASRSPAALLTGLYAGFGPAVLASAPAAAAFFGTYDFIKRMLEDRLSHGNEAWTPFAHAVSAAAGDIAGSTVRAPFEVVKQRLQSGMYTSPLAAVKSIALKEGPAGFFAGYGSLVLRELPFDALQFPLYEFFKSSLARRRKRPLQTWETSICGSLAGGISAALTTPLDVVKTRLMTQSAANPKYHGLIHGIRTIAKEEGPKALMSGVAPRVLWISLGGAIFFGAFEASKKAFAPFIARNEADQSRKGKF